MTTVVDAEESSLKVAPLLPKDRINVMFVIVGLGIGGTENQLLELASRIDPQRFAISVCSLKGEGVIAKELRERGVHVICLRGKGPWDVRVMWHLTNTVRELKPDVLHSFLFYANLLSRIVGRFLQVPVVISSYRNALVWRTYGEWLLDGLTIRWNHAITCCSEAVRQRLLDSFPEVSERCMAIYNGVPLARFSSEGDVQRSSLSLPVGMSVVGTVCRLFEPQKGLAVLLRAFSELLKRGRVQACQLLLVGEGPAKRDLIELVSRLNIEPHVRFLGARRDVEKILPALDVFVLGSLSEGFGISIVEAMSAGIPVVATKVGGIPEIVRHEETGLLVPPGDVGAMAEAIEQLLQDRERAKAFGERGRERAQQFSIEQAVQRHEDLYERVRCGMSLHQGEGALVRTT